jgi:hypothetical protein
MIKPIKATMKIDNMYRKNFGSLYKKRLSQENINKEVLFDILYH